MAEIEVLLPKMGESVAEATITKWLKSVGDSIEEDEPIVEIATDKVDSEVPSPASGVLTKILYNEGDVVQVGTAFAIIGKEGDVPVDNSSAPSETKSSSNLDKTPEKQVTEELLAPISNGNKAIPVISTEGSNRFYSPLVKSIATKEGIPFQELETIEGSGSGGRVTKKDILAFVEQREKTDTISIQKPTSTKTPSVSVQKIESPSVPVGEHDEIIEMDRMRKLIADHMVMSKQVSPHVTSFVEADVTNIVLWRNKVKDAFLKRDGEKLTFTPIFMEAILKALKEMPQVNSMVSDNKIIIKKDINLGMATALPSGNLIVPVIHKADQYNLSGLAKKVNDLAKRARNNQLTPEEIQGGTYTVTNVGTFGNVMGTPIINQPQSAILAVGAIRKKPAVIETPQGDTIGIRHMMFLSHSYDHRNIDGALGGSFVRKVADYLEQFDLNREL
jgi:2-oxoglutarate dehydrogenase E2 component (dihydrolipoamide succinyltransferase)